MEKRKSNVNRSPSRALDFFCMTIILKNINNTRRYIRCTLYYYYYYYCWCCILLLYRREVVHPKPLTKLPYSCVTDIAIPINPSSWGLRLINLATNHVSSLFCAKEEDIELGSFGQRKRAFRFNGFSCFCFFPKPTRRKHERQRKARIRER